MKVQYIKEGFFRSYDDIKAEKDGVDSADRVANNVVKRAKKTLLEDIGEKLRNDMVSVLSKVNKGKGNGRPSVTIGILPMVFRNRNVGKDMGMSAVEMRKHMIVDCDFTNSGDTVDVVLKCVAMVGEGELRIEGSTMMKISRALKEFEGIARETVLSSGVFKDMTFTLRLENKEDLNNVASIYYDLCEGYYEEYFLSKFEEGTFDALARKNDLAMTIGQTAYKYNYNTGIGGYGKVWMSLDSIKILHPKVVVLPKEHNFNFVFDESKGYWEADVNLREHPAYRKLSDYGPDAKEFKLPLTCWISDADGILQRECKNDSFTPAEDTLAGLIEFYKVKLSRPAYNSAVKFDKELRDMVDPRGRISVMTDSGRKAYKNCIDINIHIKNGTIVSAEFDMPLRYNPEV